MNLWVRAARRPTRLARARPFDRMGGEVVFRSRWQQRLPPISSACRRLATAFWTPATFLDRRRTRPVPALLMRSIERVPPLLLGGATGVLLTALPLLKAAAGGPRWGAALASGQSAVPATRTSWPRSAASPASCPPPWQCEPASRPRAVRAPSRSPPNDVARLARPVRCAGQRRVHRAPCGDRSEAWRRSPRGLGSAPMARTRRHSCRALHSASPAAGAISIWIGAAAILGWALTSLRQHAPKASDRTSGITSPGNFHIDHVDARGRFALPKFFVGRRCTQAEQRPPFGSAEHAGRGRGGPGTSIRCNSLSVGVRGE